MGVWAHRDETRKPGFPIDLGGSAEAAPILIDLDGDGVTGNDGDDSDTGPNLRQNFPLLTEVKSFGGETRITGTLVSTPDSPFSVEFFSVPVVDPGNHGEGRTFLGSITVVTDSAGTAPIDTTLPVFVTPGDVTREVSKGCNLLIRDGAHPVLDAEDLVAELELILGPSQAARDTIADPQASPVFEALAASGSLGVDELAQQVDLARMVVVRISQVESSVTVRCPPSTFHLSDVFAVEHISDIQDQIEVDIAE